MARGEQLSTLALYNYDNSLFDELTIPEGLDKTTLINNILLATTDFEVNLPNADVYKEAIGIWSKARVKSWEYMFNVLYEENYKPFSNLSRNERNVETRNLNSSGETLNKVSAFDSNNLQNKDSTTSNVSDSGNIIREHEIEGNSAMFTKQNIIEQEIKVRIEYDLFKIITDEFKKEFCLLIY